MLMNLRYALPFLLLPAAAIAQDQKTTDSAWVAANYTKQEVYIPMRDGVRLFTAVYAPKDASEQHPFLINRTPYSIQPYGRDTFSKALWTTHWLSYAKEGYIIVLQDVRGRFMSEGQFEDVRPFNANKGKKGIDEAGDTYDTIDWLIKNIKNNNGKAGIFGISYPGFYATMGALSRHPALKAASPQAPVTDWFEGDDFHHNGAFMLMDAFSFYSVFGKPRPQLEKTWKEGFKFPSQDNYDFYLQTGGIADFSRLMGDSIAFWKDLVAHPDNDAWWQARNTRNHVQHIPAGTATLVVGGLEDAEDCFGAWNLYKAIEEKAKNDNRLVIGPWAHGYWARDKGEFLGNIRFGSKTSEWYQQNIEVPYFNYFLKGKGDIGHIKEATVFFTGANTWRSFDRWPAPGVKNTPLYFSAGDALSFSAPAASGKAFSEYVSDPAHPVPYADGVHLKRTREYMTDDQRFAARRPDVLVFSTEPLEKDMTLAGPVVADLYASLSTTDADFVVKLIDVFPDDFRYTAKDGTGNGKDYPMGGYQMLVRGEVMRGRYRNSLEKPEAFVPGTPTQVRYALPDVAHVFKKGHRIMVQVQSSWFPLTDRNPQQFINIYQAGKNDFIPSTIRIWHDAAHPSGIILPVLE